MEKQTMLVLSTAHVKDSTAHAFDTDCIDPELIFYPKSDYGWFIHIPREWEYIQDLKNKIPDELYNCCVYAFKQKADWIMFDRDADEDPNLPTFEW